MQAENPLEHIVQHPLIERPAHLGPLTPDGVVTIFSDQIAMLAAGRCAARFPAAAAGPQAPWRARRRCARGLWFRERRRGHLPVPAKGSRRADAAAAHGSFHQVHLERVLLRADRQCARPVADPGCVQALRAASRRDGDGQYLGDGDAGGRHHGHDGGQRTAPGRQSLCGAFLSRSLMAGAAPRAGRDHRARSPKCSRWPFDSSPI